MPPRPSATSGATCWLLCWTLLARRALLALAPAQTRTPACQRAYSCLPHSKSLSELPRLVAKRHHTALQTFAKSDMLAICNKMKRTLAQARQQIARPEYSWAVTAGRGACLVQEHIVLQVRLKAFVEEAPQEIQLHIARHCVYDQGVSCLQLYLALRRLPILQQRRATTLRTCPLWLWEAFSHRTAHRRWHACTPG